MPQRLRNGPYSSARERIHTGLPAKSRQTSSPVPNRRVQLLAVGCRSRHRHAAGRIEVRRRRAEEPGVPEQPAIRAMIAIDVQPIVEPAIGRRQENLVPPYHRSADAGPVQVNPPADVFVADHDTGKSFLGGDAVVVGAHASPGQLSAYAVMSSKARKMHPIRRFMFSPCDLTPMISY